MQIRMPTVQDPKTLVELPNSKPKPKLKSEQLSGISNVQAATYNSGLNYSFVKVTKRIGKLNYRPLSFCVVSAKEEKVPGEEDNPCNTSKSLLETDPKASSTTAAGRRNNTVIDSSELFENQYIYIMNSFLKSEIR